MRWQPTPVFLPGKFHGQRSLANTVHRVTESDVTEHAHTKSKTNQQINLYHHHFVLSYCEIRLERHFKTLFYGQVTIPLNHLIIFLFFFFWHFCIWNLQYSLKSTFRYHLFFLMVSLRIVTIDGGQILSSWYSSEYSASFPHSLRSCYVIFSYSEML